MKRIAFLLPVLLAASAWAQPFVHPGISQTRADLDFMKQKVASGEQPWKQAWDNLLRQPYSSLDFQPQPVAHILRGAYGRGAVGDRDLSNSANAAYSHALQWYITGNRAHARKAIDILNAWSATLWDFEGNDAKLLAGWTGEKLCNAAEILRSTGSGWAAKDIEQFKRLLLAVYHPLLRDFFPEANGNWDAAIEDTLLAMGVFCDDRAMFDRARDHFLRGSGNGGITHYIYASGQCDENTRDQGHAQLGLGYFAQAARVAWNQGVDLYATADNRLALGFEFTSRYMLGEDVPVFGIISPQGRGRFSDIYESVYQHYHFVKGLDMPYTARAAGQARAMGWSALTLYRGPVAGVAPPAGGPPRPAAQAPEAGALDRQTAPPPAGTVPVAAGESVQAALDSRAAAGGGWVVLAKGQHTLSAALKIPSGVTLAGQGAATVLILDPKLTGPAIVNTDDDLHDVTLRDFLLEGSVLSRPSSDPNQDRRVRSYQSAPSRAGIILTGQRAGQMRNLRLEHVTVQNCTHQGVAIRGASQVVVAASRFSGNGSSVVPGPGLEHNLLLTRVETAEVSDSLLEGSLSGSGLEVTHSSGITVTNNQAARNCLNGVHVAESQNVRVLGNLVEGNEAGGIVFDALMDGTRGIEVRDNIARNNGGSGIDITHSLGAKAQGNRTSDNAR